MIQGGRAYCLPPFSRLHLRSAPCSNPACMSVGPDPVWPLARAIWHRVEQSWAAGTLQSGYSSEPPF